jgi:hypothetical protein
MPKVENLTGHLTAKQQGGYSQVLEIVVCMLLVLKTKKQVKKLLMATTNKVPIFNFLVHMWETTFPRPPVISHTGPWERLSHRCLSELYTFYNPATTG